MHLAVVVSGNGVGESEVCTVIDSPTHLNKLDNLRCAFEIDAPYISPEAGKVDIMCLMAQGLAALIHDLNPQQLGRLSHAMPGIKINLGRDFTPEEMEAIRAKED